MNKNIKRYILDPTTSITKLKGCLFSKNNFMTDSSSTRYSYYKTLIDNIVLQIEIYVNPDQSLMFDDYHSVHVIDDDFWRLYEPFYTEEYDYPFLNEVINKYNQVMDELVKKGILKEKIMENKNKSKQKIIKR